MHDYLGRNSLDFEDFFKNAVHNWQQRKILEHLLFHRITSEVNASTRNIVSKIQEKLDGDRNGTEEVTTSNFNPKSYFESLKTWAELHVILEPLSDDMEKKIYNNVKHWNSREQYRTEKPTMDKQG
jgi:hypothetical protein